MNKYREKSETLLTEDFSSYQGLISTQYAGRSARVPGRPAEHKMYVPAAPLRPRLEQLCSSHPV